MMRILVIVGSTRQGRFSEKPAQWILQQLHKREGIEAQLLDLRDFPMPFFDQPTPPAMPGRPPYEHEVVKKWTAQIGASDGFVFVTPEYNYGPSAVLKNAIDWVYPEWNRKAAAFVSYGSVMGSRAVQQLRETATEIQMAPVRSSVHIPVATLWAHFQGGDVDKGLAELDKQANVMIDLLWWTAALKTAARVDANEDLKKNPRGASGLGHRHGPRYRPSDRSGIGRTRGTGDRDRPHPSARNCREDWSNGPRISTGRDTRRGLALGIGQEPGCGCRGYRCEQRWVFSKSLHRRTGSADVAKDDGDEFRRTVSEREILPASDEKEQVGPFRRHIVKHGRLGHTRHEPLHRHKDGNHWVHSRFGE